MFLLLLVEQVLLDVCHSGLWLHEERAVEAGESLGIRLTFPVNHLAVMFDHQSFELLLATYMKCPRNKENKTSIITIPSVMHHANFGQIFPSCAVVSSEAPCPVLC